MLKRFKCLLMVGILSFYPYNSFAGSFEVAPTTLSLQAEARSGALHLTNQGNRPVTIQIESFEWTQVNNQDVLTPTEDLMISPPLVKFLPADTQTVRLAVNPQVLEQEKSFRIILSELSSSNTPDGQGIHVLLQFNVPIFIEPEKKLPVTLDWSAKRTKDGLQLTARNTGNQHVKLSNLMLNPSGQSSVDVTQNNFKYILPHSEYTWDVKGRFSPQQQLSIQVDNEGKKPIHGTAIISE